METFAYEPQGVCARRFVITVEDTHIKDIEIVGGCPGNLLGMSQLLRGMDMDEVIRKFSGVQCGRKPTSCPDQIAAALQAYKSQA